MSANSPGAIQNGFRGRYPPGAQSTIVLLVLVVSLGLRAWVVLTQRYLIASDEVFQYLEQAHRLAFGSGVLPWEYHAGVRSWFLPAIIAGIMKLSAAFSNNPLAYLLPARLLCATLSGYCAVIGCCYGRRIGGSDCALLTGLLVGIWIPLLYFSGAVMPDIIGANVLLCAVYSSQRPAGDRYDRKAFILSGALYGLAICLRFQLLPAALIACCWQYRLRWHDWFYVMIGGLTILVPVAGVIDAVTWGAPFQSIWKNFILNGVDAVSTEFGVEPWTFYLTLPTRYLPHHPGILRNVAIASDTLLGLCAIIGATRMPSLGLAALAVLVSHSLVAHKEVRFIYFVLLSLPVFVGTGVNSVLRWTFRGRRILASWIASMVFFLTISVFMVHVELYNNVDPIWSYDRAALDMFLAAGEQQDMCGLGVRNPRWPQTGGYTYLNRPVPLYFRGLQSVSIFSLAGVADNTDVILSNKPVPQMSDAQFDANTERYNYLIASPSSFTPGYVKLLCEHTGGDSQGSSVCLFRRAGACQD